MPLGNRKVDIEWIRSILTELSGSGKSINPTARRHGLYSTMTLPGLDDMQAVRDTLKRFDDFDVPEDLTGKTVLDLGANVGAVSFEAAIRGASRVIGAEYRDDRVSLCNIIAKYFDLNDHVKFFPADFNEGKQRLKFGPDEPPPEKPWRVSSDIVFCCSVDEYILDRLKFYKMLFEVTNETLYLESNVQRGQSIDMTVVMLSSAGFDLENISHLGNGHSGGISRKRILFKAVKNA